MTTGKKVALGLITLIALGGGGILLYNKFGKKDINEEALMEEATSSDNPTTTGTPSTSTEPKSETQVRGSLKDKSIDKILESDVTVKSSPLPLKYGSIGRLVLITQKALRKLGNVDLNETGILDKPTALSYMNDFYKTTGEYQNNIKAIEKNQSEINSVDKQISQIKDQIKKSPKTASLYTKTLNDLASKRNSLNKIDGDLRLKNSFSEISSSNYAALMNRHGGFNKLFAEAQQDAEFMKKWNKFTNA